MKRFFLSLILAVTLTGCQLPPGPQTWTRTEMFFGLSKPDGSRIEAQEWQAFVDEVVTPRFPSGLSIVDTSGQWRMENGEIQREPSKTLILLHPSDPKLDAQIDYIRRIYCEKFSQEAVMKVTTRAAVAF